MSHKPQAIGPSLSARLLLRAFTLICTSLPVLYLASCGKVGAPVPPSRITERTSELNAVQRGSNILLSWPTPALTQRESSSSYIARIDIYRLTEQRSAEPVLDPDDFEEEAEVVGYLDRSGIEEMAKQFGRLQFTDRLDVKGSGELAGARLRYAVRYVNKRGQAASFSNTVAIEPFARIAMPPTRLRARSEAQDTMVLSWEPPQANIEGSQPASVIGYNIYRRTAKQELMGKPLNSEPITELTYTDARFQYRVDYVYAVRALSQGTSALIESADSEPLSFQPVDVFPPSVPNPVSVASANGIVSLFWPSNPERDVIGYNIYRAESADAPDKNWTKLNDQPLISVTFRDDRVVIGLRYYYKVTAVDRFDNESAPSTVVGESAVP